jgi:phage-related protein
MIDLSPTLLVEKNKLASTSAWLILLDVVLPNGTDFYLVRNTDDVMWSGKIYTAFPFDLEAINQTVKGEFPSINVSISNVTRVLEAYLDNIEGGMNSTITIHIVNSQWLSENTSYLDITGVVLNVSITDTKIDFQIGAPNPLRQRFPLNRYLASHCNWKFKSAECNYQGTITTCNRSYSNCLQLNNTFRFGGYVGMNKAGVKFV